MKSTFHMLFISEVTHQSALHSVFSLCLAVSPDEIQDSLVTVAGQLLRPVTFQITSSLPSGSENWKGSWTDM